jgi:hypothetical protein
MSNTIPLPRLSKLSDDEVDDQRHLSPYFCKPESHEFESGTSSSLISLVSLLFNDTYDVTSNFIVGMNIVPISITFQSRVRVVDVDEYDAHSSFHNVSACVFALLLSCFCE